MGMPDRSSPELTFSSTALKERGCGSAVPCRHGSDGTGSRSADLHQVLALGRGQVRELVRSIPQRCPTEASRDCVRRGAPSGGRFGSGTRPRRDVGVPGLLRRPVATIRPAS